MARTEELERDRDALLESWADALPEALAGLTGQERNKVYKMLHLEVTPTADGFGVTGALAGILCSRIDTTDAASTPNAPPAGSSTWKASPTRSRRPNSTFSRAAIFSGRSVSPARPAATTT